MPALTTRNAGLAGSAGAASGAAAGFAAASAAAAAAAALAAFALTLGALAAAAAAAAASWAATSRARACCGLERLALGPLLLLALAPLRRELFFLGAQPLGLGVRLFLAPAQLFLARLGAGGVLGRAPRPRRA